MTPLLGKGSADVEAVPCWALSARRLPGQNHPLWPTQLRKPHEIRVSPDPDSLALSRRRGSTLSRIDAPYRGSARWDAAIRESPPADYPDVISRSRDRLGIAPNKIGRLSEAACRAGCRPWQDDVRPWRCQCGIQLRGSKRRWTRRDDEGGTAGVDGRATGGQVTLTSVAVPIEPDCLGRQRLQP